MTQSHRKIQSMNTINALKVAASMLIAVASFNAWSQASEPVAAPAMTASSGATSKTARQANRALRKQIYAAIAKHKGIPAGSISVSAKSGAVTLGGTVQDAAHITTVAEIA